MQNALNTESTIYILIIINTIPSHSLQLKKVTVGEKASPPPPLLSVLSQNIHLSC